MQSRSKTIVLFVVTGLLCLGAIAILSRSQTSNTVYLLVLGSAALLFCEYMALDLFFSKNPRTFLKFSATQSCFFLMGISLVIGVLIELGTLIGAPLATPLNLSNWSVKRIVLFSFMTFGGLLFRYWYWDDNPIKPLVFEIRQVVLSIGFKKLGAAFVISLIACIVGTVIFCSNGYAFGPAITFLIATVIACSGIILLWPHLGNNPEYGFLVVIVAAGIYLAGSVPTMTLVSWDDEIHYQNAASLSYVFNAEVSDGEFRLRHPQAYLFEETDFPMTYVSTVESGVSWQEDSINGYESYINYSIEKTFGYRPAEGDFTPISYQSFGYMASAAGLWIARLLHLPFSWAFFMGKLFSLLCYALICFEAIRIIPSKKTLLATISLLPTCVFLAANYSYDPWVTSMLGLAIALALREMNQRDTPFNSKVFAAISIAFIVGLGPKAIYFPLIGLLFLMPKQKFSSAKAHRCFLASTVVLACVVLCSFVVPFLVASGGSGDLRGGSDVNPSGQISYMLNNPDDAALTFIRFIFGSYLTLPSSDDFTLLFAYLGSTKIWIPWLSGLPTLYLFLVAILDNHRNEVICKIGGKLWALFLSLATIALIALALYVSFTPVGLNTINGVQGRYLLPLLLPCLGICLSLPFETRLNRSAFSGICLSLSALLLFTSICCMIPLRIIA